MSNKELFPHKTRAAQIYLQEKARGGNTGIVGGMTVKAKQLREKFDPRNAFHQGGLLPEMFPLFFKAYRATAPRSHYNRNISNITPVQRETPSTIESNKDTKIIAKNTMVLPRMARDMNIIGKNISKLLKMVGGKPTNKADSYFENASTREKEYESKYKTTKVESKSPTSVDGTEKKSGIMVKIGSFIGNIFNALLVGIGLAGVGKLLENDEVRKGIIGFVTGTIKWIVEGLVTLSKFIKESLSSTLQDPKFVENIQKIFDNIISVIGTAFSASLDFINKAINSKAGKDAYDKIKNSLSDFITNNPITSLVAALLLFSGPLTALVTALGLAYAMSRDAVKLLHNMTGSTPPGGPVPDKKNPNKNKPPNKNKLPKKLGGGGKWGGIIGGIVAVGTASWGIKSIWDMTHETPENTPTGNNLTENNPTGNNLTENNPTGNAPQESTWEKVKSAGKDIGNTSLEAFGVYSGGSWLANRLHNKPSQKITFDKKMKGTRLNGNLVSAKSLPNGEILDKLQKFAVKAEKNKWFARLGFKLIAKFGLSVGMKISGILLSIAGMTFTGGVSLAITAVMWGWLIKDLYDIYEVCIEFAKEMEGEKEDKSPTPATNDTPKAPTASTAAQSAGSPPIPSGTQTEAPMDSNSPTQVHKESSSIGANESGGDYNVSYADKKGKDGKYTNSLKDVETPEQWSKSNLGKEKKLTDMTLGEVRAFQKYRKTKGNYGAVGKYGFMEETIFGREGKSKGLKDTLKIKDDEKFSPEIQEKLQKALYDQNKKTLMKGGTPEGEITEGMMMGAQYVGASGMAAVLKAAKDGKDISVQRAIIDAGFKDPVVGKTNNDLSTVKVKDFEKYMLSKKGKIGKGSMSPPEEEKSETLDLDFDKVLSKVKNSSIDTAIDITKFLGKITGETKLGGVDISEITNVLTEMKDAAVVNKDSQESKQEFPEFKMLPAKNNITQFGAPTAPASVYNDVLGQYLFGHLSTPFGLSIR